ncbi:MAG: two-component system nitrogen regulation sensor histidine kinase GlnL [Lysobacterales bacterium]
MLNVLDTVVLELDENDRIRQMNEAAELCLGTGKDRAKGVSLAQINRVPPDLIAAIALTRKDLGRRHLRECHMAGGLYDCNIQALDKNFVLLEMYDLRWEHQRQQLKQREVQTGMLELLRRNLGHEIRNPLGGIRGAAQMMAAELAEQELGTLARLIMREVDRIDELIQKFGQPKLELNDADIHKVMDEAIEVLMAESGGEIIVERDFDPSIPQISGDASALRQIILNLVLNAYQAKAGKIVLRSRIEHGFALFQAGKNTCIRIDVDDDGEGVPEHLRAMLFLPFVTGRRDGTGLGLALAQQVAAAHGGLLSYEALDQGSRFSLRLPIHKEDTALTNE